MIAITSLLPVFGYAAIFYIYFKKTVSVSIFFSISSIITILFVFGMMDFLKYGAYILFYGGMGLLLFLSIWFKDKLFEAVKSVPFVMFTVMSIIYLYLMQDAKLFFWDEYSHWGAAIKEMYYFHHFYDTASILTALHYPPGMATWEYFIVAITGFSEGTLYFSYFLILFSATLMMYEKLSFKQLHWVALIFIIQMVVFADFGHWFSCIYIDHVVGVMFAGLILSFLVDKFSAKELMLFGLPLSAIVLFKEIGLYFGLAFIGLVLVLELLRGKLHNQKSLFFNIKEKKRVILILSLLAISMFLVLKVWGIRQTSVGVGEHSQSMSKIVKTLLLNDSKVLKDDKATEVKKRFWEVVTYQQLHKEKISLNYNEFSYGTMSKYTKNIKLTTIGSFLFFIFMFVLLYFSIDAKNKKVETNVIGSYLLFIGIVYLFILYFSFLVAFGNGALRIPSYVRYMNIAILPLMLIGFSLMLPLYYDKEYFKKKSKYALKLFLIALATITILIFITKPYLKPLYSQLENGFRTKVDKATENILKKVPHKSTIFVVFPVRNNGSLNNILRYSLIPARATVSHRDFDKETSKEMMDIYAKYDYVWFTSLNQEIINKNRKILRAKGKKGVFTLYKIEKNSTITSYKPIM